MPAHRFGSAAHRRQREDIDIPPFVRAFIDAREWRTPLPPTSDDPNLRFDQERQAGSEDMSNGHVRAGQLYNVYADTAEAAGERVVLSHVDFGMCVQALGHEVYRDSEGRYYTRLNLDAREERARMRAYKDVLTEEWLRLFEAEEAAHVDDCPNMEGYRVDGQSFALCACEGMLSEHARQVMHLLDAALLTRPRDKTRIEAYIEDRLGTYLRS